MTHVPVEVEKNINIVAVRTNNKLVRSFMYGYFQC